MDTSRLPSPFGRSRCLLCDSLQHLVIREEGPVAVCQKPKCAYEERL